VVVVGGLVGISFGAFIGVAAGKEAGCSLPRLMMTVMMSE
jgi:hypothetical protein